MATAGPLRYGFAMPDRVLITGGAGFIGSSLADRLIQSTDAELVVVDNFDPFYPRAVKERNLAAIKASPRARFIELDLRDVAAVQSLLAQIRPSTVFHLAAKAGVRPSILDPLAYEEFNVRVTTGILHASVAAGVRNFVFASSSSVYGNNPKVPFSEADNVDRPISPYAATKKACELLCHTFQHLYGLRVAALRFFTVYGPRQRPDLAIHKFARAILKGTPITLFGDGSTSRDYTFIADILDGVVGAWRWIDRQPAPVSEVFNLGNSRPVTLSTLVQLLEEATGKRAVLERAPMQDGDVERTFADVTHAHDTFGYEPRTDFADGLRQFVAWLATQP